MNSPSRHLLLLLQLLEGQLDHQEADAAQTLLTDPAVAALWHQLRAAAYTPLPISLPSRPADMLPEEALAAFVEGRLDDEEARRVALQCSRSPLLLSEVVSTYRFLQAASEHDVSESLARRLRQLPSQTAPAFSASSSRVSYSQFAGPRSRHAHDVPPEATRADATSLQPHPPRGGDVPSSRRAPRTGRWAGSRARHWLAIALMLLVALGGTFWFASQLFWKHSILGDVPQVAQENTHENDRESRPEPDIAERSSLARPGDEISFPSDLGARRSIQGPAERLRPDRVREESELNSPDGPLEPGLAPPGTTRRGDVERPKPRESRDGQGPSAREPDPADEPPRRWLPGGENPDQGARGPSAIATGEPQPPEEPSPGDVTPARPGFAWQRLVGLLVRLGPGERWHGVLADLPDFSPAVVETLTGSWGLADLESGGQLVLGSDTSATLQTRSEGSWEIQLSRGQLGLRALPAQTEFELRAGEARWTVRSQRAGSAVALVIQQGQPQLWVRRGEVQVDDSLVRTGRRIAWTAGGSGPPEPLAESSIWMDRPPRVERIPDAIQQSLLRSSNLPEDLEQLQVSPLPLVRQQAVQWGFSLDPENSFARVLAQPDLGHRAVGLQWLFSQDPSDPRWRAAWSMLARETGDAGMIRTIVGWTLAAQRGQAIDRAEAAAMLRGLNHQNLTVRQASIFFLERNFGPLVAYRPDASPELRRQSAQQWGLALRRLIR